MHNDIRTIFYATDLSERCEEVLAHSIGMVNQCRARLQVLTVIPDQRETSLIEVDSLVPHAVLNKYHDGRTQRVKQHIESRIDAFHAVRAFANNEEIA